MATLTGEIQNRVSVLFRYIDNVEQQLRTVMNMIENSNKYPKESVEELKAAAEQLRKRHEDVENQLRNLLHKLKQDDSEALKTMVVEAEKYLAAQ